MTKCPKKYKNLGSDSFGEQKYVTSDMLHQFCKNDAWLKGQVEDLFYLSPPATRKRFTPIPVDDTQSYGYKLGNNNNYVFNNSKSDAYYIKFEDSAGDREYGEKYIDSSKSTAVIESKLNDDGDGVTKVITIPKLTETDTEIDTQSTRNYSPWTRRDSDGNIISDDMTCNEFWYIGFDKARHYHCRPNWLTNQLNGEIPGITRGQTFKAGKSGILEGITLNLRGGTNTGTPLVVEIRRTEMVNGVLQPVDSDQPHLAYQEVRFDRVDPGVYTVVFEHPPTVKEGETYAVVLLSPLSHPSNAYSIGGWSASCSPHLYEKGHAFLSENCGYTWILHGKKDASLPYHSGQQVPEDFAFQCHIKQVKTTTPYDTSKTYSLYFKPFFTNDVEKVTLSVTDAGEDSVQNDITYYVSNDGRNWHQVGGSKSWSYSFEKPKHYTFIRADLKTSDKNKAPYIEGLDIYFTTKEAKEGYIRTIPYYPPLDGILSANVWARFNTPYVYDGSTVSCETEIILDKIVTEHFLFIEPKDVVNYPYLDKIDFKKLKPLTSTTNDAVLNETASTYFENNLSLLQYLSDNKIYLIGFTNSKGEKIGPKFRSYDDVTDVDDNGNLTNKNSKYPRISILQSAAYPMFNCIFTPNSDSKKSVTFSEFIDYSYDYQNDTIDFYDTSIGDLGVGSLSLEFNPLFVDGLNGEYIYNNDKKTYLPSDSSDMPFGLDYHVEIISMNDTYIEQKSVPLQMPLVDPVKLCVKNPESDDNAEDDEVTLLEDVDFTINYDTHTLHFTVDADNNIAVTRNDIIKIVYTPALYDNSFKIGYSFKKENLNDNISIMPNYIEYKS